MKTKRVNSKRTKRPKRTRTKRRQFGGRPELVTRGNIDDMLRKMPSDKKPTKNQEAFIKSLIDDFVVYFDERAGSDRNSFTFYVGVLPMNDTVPHLHFFNYRGDDTFTIQHSSGEFRKEVTASTQTNRDDLRTYIHSYLTGEGIMRHGRRERNGEAQLRRDAEDAAAQESINRGMAAALASPDLGRTTETEKPPRGRSKMKTDAAKVLEKASNGKP